MRVHELASELKISSRDLLAKLRELGVEAKSHMSTVEPAAAELMREAFAASAQKSSPLPEPATAKPAVPAPSSAPPPPSSATQSSLHELEDDEEEYWIEGIRHWRKKERMPSRSELRGKGFSEKKVEPKGQRPAPKSVPPPKPETAVEGKIIRVKGPVVVRELAERLGIRPNQLITELMSMNVLASITQRVDVNVAKVIAERHGFVLEHEKRSLEHKEALKRQALEEIEEDRPEDLQPRPPVVTFLGHVDHGKTSLLDRIRNTAVAKGEYGGITQHIGAYTVDVGGRSITFLDTPGHAAFTAMRARGANLTDIAVIVVAADDGIMPQTREAIMHARAANVAIMVAINKIDLPGAQPERVKQQLQGEGLTPEDWGGNVICCPVSAITGAGIDHLLEMILLQADILDLKANYKRRARGYVIEARLEPGMGPTANLLIKNGTLKVGDAILCGPYCGRVRALINDHGVQVKAATPSMPVKCLGLSGVPEPGVEFRVCPDEKTARELACQIAESEKSRQLVVPRKVSLDTLFERIKESSRLELRVILKADTQGSVEAITTALSEIKSEKVVLKIILAATGNVTINDVMLASASDAVILGFHVAKEPGVDAACRREGVEVRLHQIIYELVDQVRDAMTGLLAPEVREKVVGRAEVKAIFPLGKTAKVAGCLVVSGNVRPRYKARVKRGDEVLYQGSILSLKHFKDSVAEVREGQECGIRLDNFNGFEVGDIIELYETEEVKQTL